MTSRVIRDLAVMVVIAFTKHRYTEMLRGDFTPWRVQRCSPTFAGKQVKAISRNHEERRFSPGIHEFWHSCLWRLK